MSRTTQAAFDALDLSCAKRDIDSVFAPRIRTAFAYVRPGMPERCVQSVVHVAKEIANVTGEIPTGYGSALVKHFDRRGEQIRDVVGEDAMSPQSRFALIELTAIACMTGQWTSPDNLRKTVATYKTRMRDVADVAAGAALELEREAWRATVVFLLDGSPVIPVAARNFAYALMWGGYISPGDQVREELLASQWRETREQFIRARQEGLRTLSMIRNARSSELRRGPEP